MSLCVILVVNSACQLFHSYKEHLSKIELSEELVQLLREQEVISEATLTEVETVYNGYLVSDSVVIDICTTIAEDHNKLRIMIDLLLKFDESQSLGQEMFDKYSKYNFKISHA